MTHETILAETTIIRQAIKKYCPSLSIVVETGTAYGWINVIPDQDRYRMTSDEIKALEDLGFTFISRSGVTISPKERSRWAKKLCENPDAKYERINENFHPGFAP